MELYSDWRSGLMTGATQLNSIQQKRVRDIMNMLSIYYFLAVAREGNMTAAAEKLHLSQPALSTMIARLEKELKHELFDRVGRQIVLNRYGKAFQTHAEAIYEENENAVKDFYRLENDGSNALTLAVTGMLFPQKLIQAYLNEYPETNLKQVLIAGYDTEEALGRADVDFVLSAYPIRAKNVNVLVLWEEKLYVAMPKGEAKPHRSLRITDLKDRPLVCLPQGHAYRQMVEELCASKGFAPRVTVECFPDQIAGFVAGGRGAALTHQSAVDRGEFDDTTCTIALLSDEDAKRTISLVWKSNLKLRKNAQIFLEFVQDYVKV